MRQWLLAQGLTASLCVVVLAFFWRSWGDAAHARHVREAAMQSTVADIKELLRLRGQANVPVLASIDDDPLSHLRRSLADAGIDEAAFAGLQRLGDRPMGDNGLITRRLRLRLNDITPEQLGRFLLAWSADSSPWQVIACRLSQQGQAVDPNRFTVSLIVRASLIGGGA